jgi:hypothetical protein
MGPLSHSSPAKPPPLPFRCKPMILPGIRSTWPYLAPTTHWIYLAPTTRWPYLAPTARWSSLAPTTRLPDTQVLRSTHNTLDLPNTHNTLNVLALLALQTSWSRDPSRVGFRRGLFHPRCLPRSRYHLARMHTPL